eukprot:763060-Hanusia_phi.AAC.2
MAALHRVCVTRTLQIGTSPQTILFLHGFGTGMGVWLNSMAGANRLRTRQEHADVGVELCNSATVYAIDLPGHGLSSRPEFTGEGDVSVCSPTCVQLKGDSFRQRRTISSNRLSCGSRRCAETASPSSPLLSSVSFTGRMSRGEVVQDMAWELISPLVSHASGQTASRKSCWSRCELLAAVLPSSPRLAAVGDGSAQGKRGRCEAPAEEPAESVSVVLCE